MFSGIIEAVGIIEKVAPVDGGVRIAISCGRLDLSDVNVGDSIAVDGVCLTVVEKNARGFGADVSRETLRLTAGLDREKGEVNLEKALKLSGRINGHLVSGHVDGVGEVTEFRPAGASYTLAVRAPDELGRYIARKGSIAVNGVSLTVNEIQGADFSVNLIPHTLAATTFKHLHKGARVNLEVDMVARYLEKLMAGG